MPRARLDTAALRAAGLPLSAPLCLSPAAWETDIELPDEAPEAPDFVAPGLAYVEIVGPLSKAPDTLCGWFDGYQGECGIVGRFRRALSAPEARALLIYFDTPGGTTEGLEDAIAQMLSLSALYQKPIVGWVDNALSAGYWIASRVCGTLFGGVASQAGSIGSYITHVSIAGALAQEGEAVTLLANPPGKVAGNPYEPLSDLGRARFQRSVDACTGRFFADVEIARGIPAAVLAELNGDILEGAAAVQAGLLDGLSDLETTIQYALALANTPAPQEGT